MFRRFSDDVAPSREDNRSRKAGLADLHQGNNAEKCRCHGETQKLGFHGLPPLSTC